MDSIGEFLLEMLEGLGLKGKPKHIAQIVLVIAACIIIPIALYIAFK